MITTKGKLTRVLTLVLVLATVFSCAAYSTLGAESLMSGSAGKGYASASPASECPVAIELLPGAEVRLDEEQSGLRFTTRIPTADLAAIAGEYTVGTLIYPTDRLEGALTVATEGALNLTDATPIVDGEYTYFYAAIVDILPANYARKFSAVSYIKIGDNYFYTEYSEADNSRSIFEVAVAAWEGNYKDNSIIKAYLDKVVVINGSMQLSKAIKGYTSPYNVSYANNTITVTATDGTLVDGDIATMIVDYNGRVFTGGWTIANNTLTAPYKASLNLVQGFDGVTQAETTGGFNKNNFWYNGSAGLNFSVADGVANLKKPQAASSAKTYPKMAMTGSVANAIGDTNDTLIFTMSFKIPEGCTEIQRGSFRLAKSNYNVGQLLLGNLAMKQNAVYVGGVWDTVKPEMVVAYLSSTDWVDLSLAIDFIDSEMDVYVNGSYVTTLELDPSINLDYAKAMTWAPMYIEFTHFQNTAGSWGVSIDSFSWGVAKTH